MSASTQIDPRIISREEFIVLGTLTRITAGTESGEKFAGIWKGFEARRGQIEPHSTDKRYYGVSFPTGEEGRFDYVAAMAVMPVETIPDGLVMREVPAACYAVFECPMTAIAQTYGYIFGEWRSNSGHRIDCASPAFEQYPPALNTESSVLIHIPIRKQQSK